jgi:AcrR family transcriptional regulator
MERDASDSAYLEAKRAARDALRARLLRVAGERLETEGFEALSMRPLARAAGCSTMVFYTEFGSKDGLLEAIADARADELLEAVETVADIDAASHRRAVARAYLDSVAAAPEAYRVMMRQSTAAGSERTEHSAVERRARLARRLTAALVPDEDGVGYEAMDAVVMALEGAAQRLVAGEADQDTLSVTLEALLDTVSRRSHAAT